MNISMVVNETELRKRRLTKDAGDRLFGIALLIPAFVILGLVVFFPVVKGIIMSFMDYCLATLKNPKWNNFQNYISIFKSGEVFLYFFNTFVFVFFTVFIQLVMAMAFALLLNTNIRGKNIFRGLMLVPWTIPSVVVALLWGWLLNPQFGVFNYIFYKTGLINTINFQWLQSPSRAMPAVVMASLWKQTPYMITMLLAGLQSISSDLLEAAEIDGANKFQVFRYIIIPSIRPVIDTSVMLSIINNFQQFTIIQNMTAGGPLNKTQTLSLATYHKGFVEFNLGQAAALGVLWLVVLGFFVVMFNWRSAKNNADLI